MSGGERRACRRVAGVEGNRHVGAFRKNPDSAENRHEARIRLRAADRRAIAIVRAVLVGVQRTHRRAPVQRAIFHPCVLRTGVTRKRGGDGGNHHHVPREGNRGNEARATACQLHDRYYLLLRQPGVEMLRRRAGHRTQLPAMPRIHDEDDINTSCGAVAGDRERHLCSR